MYSVRHYISHELVCKTYAKFKNQLLVVNSIKFKEPIFAKQFVNAKENSISYTIKKPDRTDSEDAAAKKIQEERVSHQVKFQIQEYQKSLTFIQTLWNIVYVQCSEFFQLVLIKRGTELGEWTDYRRDKNLLKLLELINLVWDDGNTSTNKDGTYVCLVQACKFHNFIQQPSKFATKLVHNIANKYDILKNCLGSVSFGDKLMIKLIRKKHNDTSGIAVYYNSNNALLIPALDQAYKEQILSCFIIMNDNMKEGCNKMLRNQQIYGTMPFDLKWGQATSLLDCESLKVMNATQQ